MQSIKLRSFIFGHRFIPNYSKYITTYIDRVIKDSSKSNNALHKIKQSIYDKLDDHIILKDKKKSIKSLVLNENLESNDKIEPFVRLNRCLRPLTRKLADEAIAAGKVYVNDVKATLGMKIYKTDKVFLENHGEIVTTTPAFGHILHPLQIQNKHDLLMEKKKDHELVYIKIWKPKGLICSASRKEKHSLFNLITSNPGQSLPLGRLHCVGTLDKDVEGLVLLTNDGRLRNAVYNKKICIESNMIISVEGKLTNTTPKLLKTKESSLNKLENEKYDNNFSSSLKNDITINSNDNVATVNKLSDITQTEEVTVNKLENSDNFNSNSVGSSYSSIKTVDNPVILKSSNKFTEILQESSDRISVKRNDVNNEVSIKELKKDLGRSFKNCQLSKVERVSLGDIDMSGLETPGSSKYLNSREIKFINKLLADANINNRDRSIRSKRFRLKNDPFLAAKDQSKVHTNPFKMRKVKKFKSNY